MASGVAWRTLKNVFTNPSLFVPSLVFPLFFFTAFAGGLSQVSDLPGFDFPPGYTAFQFVFVLLQSAAFSGVFTGFGVARDFEGGFAKRLMLAAPRRSGIVLGYAAAALVRWSIVAVGFGAIGSWLALRTGSGEAIQGLFPLLFVFLFISSMNTPRNLIAVGWFQFLASINPISYLIECVRSLIITGWDARALALGFGIAIVLAIVAVVVASREMGRRLDRS